MEYFGEVNRYRLTPGTATDSRSPSITCPVCRPRIRAAGDRISR